MVVPITDILRYLELTVHPSYTKDQFLFIPLNCSMVLRPQEVRGISLPLRFPPTMLQQVSIALHARSVDFVFKTDGCRIWGFPVQSYFDTSTSVRTI